MVGARGFPYNRTRPTAAPSPLDEAALSSAVAYLVGDTRAFALKLTAALREIGDIRDPRMRELVETLETTLAVAPGTLAQLERTATAALRSLADPPGAS